MDTVDSQIVDGRPPQRFIDRFITRVESELFRSKFDQMEAAGIPNDRDHHFFNLYCVSLPFKNLFVQLKPYQLMVHTEV
jgi:hypothetical protein